MKKELQFVGLKPCPLCGGTADMPVIKTGYMMFEAKIRCNLCGLELNWRTEYCEGVSLDGKRTAIQTSLDPFEAWNRRARDEK